MLISVELINHLYDDVDSVANIAANGMLGCMADGRIRSDPLWQAVYVLFLRLFLGAKHLPAFVSW